MATFDSTTYTAQQAKAYTRNVNPSFRELQQPLRYAVFSYTLAGTEANGDIINLGSLGVDNAIVIPHLSSLRDTGGTGDVDFDAKLNALIDGTSTDLSGVASCDNTRAAFADKSDPVPVEIDADDVLRLIISDASLGAVTAGETIIVEVCYRTKAVQ